LILALALIGFQTFNSLQELNDSFPTEISCVNFLEDLRWNGEVSSPFDEFSRVYQCQSNRYRCRNTGKYFNVRTNTIFHGSKLELRTWFQAIWYYSRQPELSPVELSALINVSPKTAWLIQKRLPKPMNTSELTNNEMALTDWLSQLS